MVTTRASSEQRVVLRNISWQTFETMLAEMGNDRASRMAYDNRTSKITLINRLYAVVESMPQSAHLHEYCQNLNRFLPSSDIHQD